MDLHSFILSPRRRKHSLGVFAAASLLALVLTGGAQAKTFPAVPTSSLPPAPAAAPQSKPRPASPGIPFAGLSLEAQDGVSLLYTNQGGYGFGTANPLDTPQITAVFHLKNDTNKPITLSRLEPSCHCTHAEPLPLSPTLPTIAPGQTAAIRVTVDLAGHPAGNLEKTVTVYVAGSARPAAVLAVEGVLTPLVSLTPTLLDFGVVAAGQEKILPVTVTVDPRLIPSGVLPELRSSNAALRLVPQPAVVTPASAGASKTLTRSYVAVLSASAPLGPVNGSLSFAPSSQADSVATEAFSGGSVLLLGQVQGEVSALPQSLAFGTIKQGEEATRQVALMGNSADAVKSVSVSSPSAFISARLQPLSPTFGAGGQLVTNARTLMVTLSRNAPPGTVQTQLKVSLASGHRLIVPITAYVSTPVTF
jgi:hypothetical protein